MPAPKRARRALTHAWDPIQHYVSWPEQDAYEVIRPMTLFGVTAAERAREIGVAERTLERRADLFDAAGMASLFPEPTRSPEDRRQVPAEIRQRILALKAEYPAFHPHEIASILRRRDDCRIHHNTVQRILANNVLPTGVR